MHFHEQQNVAISRVLASYRGIYSIFCYESYQVLKGPSPEYQFLSNYFWNIWQSGLNSECKLSAAELFSETSKKIFRWFGERIWRGMTNFRNSKTKLVKICIRGGIGPLSHRDLHFILHRKGRGTSKNVISPKF